MVYKIVWTRRSQKDLKAIKEYIAQNSIYWSEIITNQLANHVSILSKHPEGGIPVFPVKFKYLRKLLFKSYRIIYHFSGDDVTIITVHHQSRLVENIPQIKIYKE